MTNLNSSRAETRGDCESCSATNVILTHTPTGNMWLCKSCFELDANARKAIKTLEHSRHVDAAIELKEDLFKAGTVSFVELQAAIENNPEIPSEKKNLQLMVEIAARIDKLTAVIFEEEAATTAKRNERHALIANAQQVAAKLHEADREKYKKYDLNYKPTSRKPASTRTSTKAPVLKFNMKALKEAAAKYNLPYAQVQSVAQARKMTPEAAAEYLAKLMGLIPSKD